MTQEEKKLLLKDLCARLPYGVKIKYATCPANHYVFTLTELNVKTSYDKQYDLHYYPKLNGIYNYFDCLPYLRSMSSMTEEEKKEYHNLCYEEEREEFEFGQWVTRVYFRDTIESIDWLNKNHFDYHGLIEKGIALEAPERMYDTNQKWTTIRSELKENENGQIVGGLKL